MKTLTIFFFCGLAIAGSAQTQQKAFTSVDGIFRFQYSNLLVNCASGQSQASCMSQGEVCDGPGSGGATLACLAYPKERFKDKPNFVAASFFVTEIQEATSEKICLQESKDWFLISPKPSTATINHISFKTFVIGDNWTGHGQSGPAYRTFHHGKCYELGIQTIISRAEYNPGTVQELTKKDLSQVDAVLKQALNSFMFLK